MIRTRPTQNGPTQNAGFVYGASLTHIRSEENSSMFVRFGGFRAGGYSHPTSMVAILTVRDEGFQISSHWEEKETRNAQVAIPRAYHTATLLGGRYLLITGGMSWGGSILDEAILDIQTWTWIETPVSTGEDKPSARHGHSVVYDNKRNRIVMFGGGNGSDLLRSGTDNSEVWELKLRVGWEDNLVDSLPWRWNKLHNGENDDSAEPTNRLSSAETLCLGRCHSSCKVSPDKVVIMFGSGRPSTNGIIAFDLDRNAFHRPIVNGIVPKPRFTGTAVCLEEGYILTHGGYSTQELDAISDMDILDLSAALDRRFDSMPVDLRRPSHAEVTDAHAEANRSYRSRAIFQLMFTGLMGMDNRTAALFREHDEELRGSASEAAEDGNDGSSDSDFEVEEDD